MKKKILIVSQHYWPENFRISDIAAGFAQRDIEVDVLCGIPNYPNGIVPDGYGLFKNTKQRHENVNIYRAWEITRKGNSNLRIFLNYVSFPFFASFRVLGLLKNNYDRIFCYETSPVYMIFPAIVASKLKKIPLTTYVLDLWPENLYSVLKVKNKFLRRILKSTSHWHYKKCEKLVAMSPSLKDTLVKITGKDVSCVAVIPHYCESFYEQEIHSEELENKYSGFFKIVYAGNISPAQNLEVAVDAAVLLKNDGINDIKFIIVGDGMSRKDIEDYVYSCGVGQYFDFLGSKPPADMPIYHTLADCLFAPLAKSDDLGLTIPAKVTGYMAAGRPVITCIDGEGSFVVEKASCGLTGPSGDSRALYSNIKKMYSMTNEERAELGRNAKAYHLKYHSREKVLDRLTDFIFS